MASKTIGISELAVVKGDNSIITYALGSCVGIALYDDARKIAGLAHCLLPSSTEMKVVGEMNHMKYVDTAVPLLIKQMERAGASTFGLIAKLAGGAQMFSMKGASSAFNIGERNVNIAIETLRKHNIKLVSRDVGENYGRTVEIFAENGIYRIKAIAKGTKDI